MAKNQEPLGMMPILQAPLLSVSDVAARLGVCRQTVYTYIYHEGLPSIKVRGIRRVHPDSLYHWLKEREHQIA
jgi:excisionase family DNA binding protein